MATLLDFCRDMSQPVNCNRYQDLINVSRPCDLVFVSDSSFHSVAVGLAILCSSVYLLKSRRMTFFFLKYLFLS